MADNLYRSCKTLLKQKLLTSNLIDKNVKKTDPEVMIGEIKRLCIPRVNIIARGTSSVSWSRVRTRTSTTSSQGSESKLKHVSFPQPAKSVTAVPTVRLARPAERRMRYPNPDPL